MRAKAFTLVELLTTILIVASLLSVALVSIVSFTQWARQTSDQRTLAVLNDALTRYKCEGGDISALTSGAPIGHVLAKIASTINWNGMNHYVMSKGVTYPARSLSASGYQQDYQFTRFNSSQSLINPSSDIVARLRSYGTPPDNTYQTWINNSLAAANNAPYMVLYQPSSSSLIGMYLKGSGSLYVNWGDNTAPEVYSLSGSNTAVKHTYLSAAKYGVTLIGNVTSILNEEQAGIGGPGCGAFGGDISTMTTLTSIDLYGTNTVTGLISNFPILTYLAVSGNNTISGSINKFPNLTYLSLSGSNSVSGDVTGLTQLTVLTVGGHSTAVGSVSNLTNLNGMSIYSTSSHITGDISNLRSLAYLSVSGSNNILTGKVDRLTSLEFLSVSGNSNFDCSTTNWNSLPSLSYVGVKNLNQTQVDALLAGMWYNKDAAKPNNGWFAACRTIQCTSGCAAPSDQSVANQLRAYRTPNNTGPMVWTVLTN